MAKKKKKKDQIKFTLSRKNMDNDDGDQATNQKNNIREKRLETWTSFWRREEKQEEL